MNQNQLEEWTTIQVPSRLMPGLKRIWAYYIGQKGEPIQQREALAFFLQEKIEEFNERIQEVA